MKIFKFLLFFILATKLSSSFITAMNSDSFTEETTGPSMPIASMWPRVKAGENLTANDKRAEFIKNCQNLAIHNITEAKNPNVARIISYNVHAWANPFFKFSKDISPKLSEICENEGINASSKVTPVFDVIDRLNADILILQEVASDKDHETGELREFEDYKKILKALGYTHGLEMNTPINELKFFGNMNKRLDHPQYGPFGNWIVSKYPFVENPVVTRFKAQCLTQQPDPEDCEARCFVHAKIALPNGQTLSVYATHLDVFDPSERVRFEQIKELMAVVSHDESDQILIAGDLNSVRHDDYTPAHWELIVQENTKRNHPTPTMVLDYLKDANFVDCFTQQGLSGPSFTTWSGTTIDFIFLKNSTWTLPINCFVDFNSASDHLPVGMDIILE